MTAFNDDDLRSRFGALREADMRGVPDFHAVRDRANNSAVKIESGTRRLPSRFALSLTLAAAAAIVLAVSVARVARRAAFVPQPLSTWTSPTASLLSTPGIDLISSPTIVSSMLNPVTAQSTLRTGTQR